MFDFIDLVKCFIKSQYLYQRQLNSNKMIPALKVGKGQILLTTDTNNYLSPEYYYRVCKYPKPKYRVIEQSDKLENWVNEYREVNGV